VIDKTGNSLLASTKVKIDPLEAPRFDSLPSQSLSGSDFVWRGNSTPNSVITLWIQKNNEDSKNYTIKTDKDGNFIFLAAEKLEEGEYKVWTMVTDDRGAKSKESSKFGFAVKNNIEKVIKNEVTSYVTILIISGLIIVVLGAALGYLVRKYNKEKKKIRKEVKEAENSIHDLIPMLKENFKDKISILHNLKTKESVQKVTEEIAFDLTNNLKLVENKLEKEISDIDKVLK
jgi:5-hydroxyisourate hydrolase-like protein (transthyretin family)